MSGTDLLFLDEPCPMADEESTELWDGGAVRMATSPSRWMASVLLFMVPLPPPTVCKTGQSSKLTEFFRLLDDVSVELHGDESSPRIGAGLWSNDGAVKSGRVTADWCFTFF